LRSEHPVQVILDLRTKLKIFTRNTSGH
jgi:hypothetical protein